MINETNNTQMAAGESERTITLYLSPVEIDALNLAAAKKGLTVSEYLICALLEDKALPPCYSRLFRLDEKKR